MANMTIYPDGSGHMKKYLGYEGVIKKLMCAKVKINGHDIVIHADEVSFEGAGLYEILMRMADDIHRLEKRVKALERKAGGG